MSRTAASAAQPASAGRSRGQRSHSAAATARAIGTTTGSERVVRYASSEPLSSVSADFTSTSSAATRRAHPTARSSAARGVRAARTSATAPSRNACAVRSASAAARPSRLPNTAYSVCRETPASRATSAIRTADHGPAEARARAAASRDSRTGVGSGTVRILDTRHDRVKRR